MLLDASICEQGLYLPRLQMHASRKIVQFPPQFSMPPAPSATTTVQSQACELHPSFCKGPSSTPLHGTLTSPASSAQKCAVPSCSSIYRMHPRLYYMMLQRRLHSHGWLQ